MENLNEENFGSKGILVHASLTPTPADKVQYMLQQQGFRMGANLNAKRLFKVLNAKNTNTFMVSGCY